MRIDKISISLLFINAFKLFYYYCKVARWVVVSMMLNVHFWIIVPSFHSVAVRRSTICDSHSECVGYMPFSDLSMFTAIFIVPLPVETLQAKINIGVKNHRISDILTATKSD